MDYLSEQRPETPPHLKPFRSSCCELGKSVKHRGFSKDPPPPSISFGIKTDRDSTSLFPQPESEIQEYHNSWQERRYKCATKCPLGTVPTVVATPPVDSSHCFGICNERHASSSQAKDILLHEEESDDETCKEMYKKSHRDYLPAEQVKRNYKWPVDPDSFRFGYKSQGTSNTGSQVKSLCQPFDCSSTSVVRSTVLKNKDNEHHIEKPRNRNSAPLDASSRCFGVSNGTSTRAGDCFRFEGEASDEELGRTRKPTKGLESVCDLTFGASTEHISQSSLGFDGYNVSCQKTLQSGILGPLGLSEEDFDVVLPVERLYELVFKVGMVKSREEFDVVIQDCRDVSLNDFRLMYSDYLRSAIQL
ncbi:hypothetical protein GEMRC1_007747 [Eukaryota sp. GEM-RC1]